VVAKVKKVGTEGSFHYALRESIEMPTRRQTKSQVGFQDSAVAVGTSVSQKKWPYSIHKPCWRASTGHRSVRQDSDHGQEVNKEKNHEMFETTASMNQLAERKLRGEISEIIKAV
jgi:hypothetical protein